MSYRSGGDSREERLLQIEADVAARGEDAVPPALLRERRALKVLAEVRVAAPCDVPWETMSGDQRVRFCDFCRKSVYNLSALSAVEAAQLLARNEEGLCVTLSRRADGTVITGDCPQTAVRRRRSLVSVLAAACAMLVSLLGSSYAVSVDRRWAAERRRAAEWRAEAERRLEDEAKVRAAGKGTRQMGRLQEVRSTGALILRYEPR